MDSSDEEFFDAQAAVIDPNNYETSESDTEIACDNIIPLATETSNDPIINISSNENIKPSNEENNVNSMPENLNENNESKENSKNDRLESDEERDSDFQDKKNPIVEKDYELIKRKERENLLTEDELKNLLNKSEEIKLEGNSVFKDGEYLSAIEKYTEALDTCPLKYESERATYYFNRAVGLSKIDKNDEAVKDCTEAIILKSDYLKALCKRAELNEKLDKLTDAFEDYKSVLKLDPNNWNALHAERTLPARIHEQQEKMKEEMMKQLKQLGNLVLKPFGLSTNNFQMVQDPNTGSYSINFKN